MYYLNVRWRRQSLVYFGNMRALCAAAAGRADEVVYLSCSTTNLSLARVLRTRRDEQQIRAPWITIGKYITTDN